MDEGLRQIIDTQLENMSVSDQEKERIKYLCEKDKSVAHRGTYKVVIGIIVILIFIGTVGNQEVMATMLRWFTYFPIENKIVLGNEEIYSLKQPLIIENEKGFIHILACTLQNGNIELKLKSNMGNEIDTWKKQVMLENNKGIKYPIVTNVAGGRNSQKENCLWSVTGWGEVETENGEFILKTPYLDIPINCTKAAPEESLEGIGRLAIDGGIQIVAQKIPVGNGSVISLNAFDANSNPLNVTFEGEKISVYDYKGCQYDYHFDKAQAYYTHAPRQFYFKNECSDIARIEVRNLKIGIMALKLDLEEFWKTQPLKQTLQIPMKGKIMINKVFKIQNHVIEIESIERLPNNPNDIEITIKLDSAKSIFEDRIIEFDKSFVCNGTYKGQLGQSKDGAIEQRIQLQNIDAKEQSVDLIITQVWVQKQGKWSINMD